MPTASALRLIGRLALILILSREVCAQVEAGHRTVRKCCAEREYLANKKCQPTKSHFLNEFERRFGFVPRLEIEARCPKGMSGAMIPPEDDDEPMFNLTFVGEDLVISKGEIMITVSRPRYCIDFIETEEELRVILCSEVPEDDIELIYFGMIISMPFLLATFVVYALIPERNLHQKALMFYVLTLLIAYICLVSTQLSGQIPPALCTTAGFLVLFFFLVSVFWMNVICIDIWFTFSGSRGFIGNSKSSEMKRFLLYCLYAWGVPILFIIVTFFINEFSDSNSNFHPNIGVRSCFLGAELPYLIYFYGPMALIIIANIVLFTLTALKIRQVKKETSMLKHSDSQRHTYEKNKQKFTLYVKLMLAMGVNWSMEVISWAVKWGLKKTPEEIWYLTDLCNALYGVFIFFIFVFKRKIWTMLKKRYYTFIGKPHLAQSLTSTQVTRTSNFSSSVTESHHDENSVRRRPEEIALNRRT